MSACRRPPPTPPPRPSPPPPLLLNRDPVRTALRAGPQPPSAEVSVARRTSTAML